MTDAIQILEDAIAACDAFDADSSADSREMDAHERRLKSIQLEDALNGAVREHLPAILAELRGLREFAGQEKS